MNKITQEVVTILKNRITHLKQQKEIAVRLGNVEAIATIDEDIVSTEETLLLLNPQ